MYKKSTNEEPYNPYSEDSKIFLTYIKLGLNYALYATLYPIFVIKELCCDSKNPIPSTHRLPPNHNFYSSKDSEDSIDSKVK